MNTLEYMDAVKARLNLPSDYALAKILNVTRSQVSAYRTGRDTLSDGAALRIAELLNVDAGRVLVDAHLERSKTPELRAAWAGLMEKISTSFEALIPRRAPRRALRPA